ncbi:unnamed protein product [Heterosigma akashiwo]
MATAALKGNIAVVVGGAGAMGRAIINKCATIGMTTVSVDFKPSQAAMVSHQLDIDKPVSEQVAGLRASLVQELVCPHERHLGGGAGLVVHAAGAFALGALDADDCLATAAALYRANVESAILTAHLATHLLTPKGLLILTGALGAVHPTPEFVGYGASKAATHHLVQSAAASDSARQGQWDVLGLLPRVIDTPSNRLTMPDADRSDWTELDDLAEISCRTGARTRGRGRLGALAGADL